ncbi:hypothetical protein BH24ACT5_BH24ACT5_20450 [soil metagenome]
MAHECVPHHATDLGNVEVASFTPEGAPRRFVTSVLVRADRLGGVQLIVELLGNQGWTPQQPAVAVLDRVIPRSLAPRMLAPTDDVDGFECRSPEQAQWLRRHAHQAHAAGTAQVLVVTQAGRHEIVA